MRDDEPYFVVMDDSDDPTVEEASDSTDTIRSRVAYGVRAAALAGLILSTGAVACGLTGVFDAFAGAANTTCCGGSK